MLTLERLRQVIEYSPDTGLFVWKVRLGKRRGAGDKAGSLVCGRIVICIDRESHHASRLAWLWMTGKWPHKFIDHINGNPADNRWSNLREVTRSQNAMNQKARQGSIKGICRVKGEKWRAQICANGQIIYLGAFETPEAAHAAYCAAAIQYHGEYARFE